MRSTWIFLVLAACSYPDPARAPDAADSPPIDGEASCPACQLLAIEPAVANAGDLVTLEGTFAPGAIVTFPGGATAPATLIGAHRATALVPAEATAGPLTVSNSAGAVTFYRAPGQLGVQPFELHDNQANSARQASTLVTGRRAAASVVVGDEMYIFGGVDVGEAATTRVDVERATINGDGSLGPFAVVPGVQLTRPRWYAKAVVLGGYVYLVGGNTEGDVDIDTEHSIERAPIHPDGSLGTFDTVQGTGLTVPRHFFELAVIGDRMYVAGGASGSTRLASVEHATIGADGSLGAFTVDEVKLGTGRDAFGSVVTRNYWYVFGGEAGAGAISTIERAQIMSDGSLGAFETLPAGLLEPRVCFATLRVGSSVTIVGGNSSGANEAATIAFDGTLGEFSPRGVLAVPTSMMAPAVHRGYAYLVGGATPSGQHVATTMRASLDASGALGAFGPSSTTLVKARNYTAIAIVGRTLYLLGGDSSSGRLDSIEQASIASDGALGAFAVSSVKLPTPAASITSAVIGRSIYVVGGNPPGVFSNAVARAVVADDGKLGPFTTAPSLVTARGTPAVAVTGPYLYVIGGSNFSGPLASVERAAINADGSLGAFAGVAGVTLATPGQGRAIAVIGNSLYVIGGATTAGALASVERATINADGSLSNFAIASTTLVKPRVGATSAVIGHWVYVFGGSDGSSALSSVERAPINADGSLGAFAIVPNVMLATGRATHAGAVIGDRVYVLGGASTSVLGSVEHAELQ